MLMSGIKTPQQDFALKLQGGGAYLRDTTIIIIIPKLLLALQCSLPCPKQTVPNSTQTVQPAS